jgi:hypothetical protein
MWQAMRPERTTDEPRTNRETESREGSSNGSRRGIQANTVGRNRPVVATVSQCGGKTRILRPMDEAKGRESRPASQPGEEKGIRPSRNESGQRKAPQTGDDHGGDDKVRNEREASGNGVVRLGKRKAT